MKMKKILTGFFLLSTMLICLSAMFISGAELSDCEEFGHDYEYDWDTFWSEYFDEGSNTVYAWCNECFEDFFFDASVTQKIAAKATTTSNGKVSYIVTIENDEGEKVQNAYTKTIYKAKKVVSSKAEYNYTGSAVTPAVSVYDSQGAKLKSGDYAVTYSSNKNVGLGKINVKLKGNYAGTLSTTFKIVPKKPALTLSAKTNSITIKWTKQTAQVDKFKIQYSTDKNFQTNVKNITVNDVKTTSKVINNLSSGKTYYVRMIAYKTVGDLTYSAYSSVKSIKTTAPISISKTSATIYKGQKLQLSAKAASGKVKWKSSDSSVAKVNNKGLVTAVGNGTVNVTAYVTIKNVTHKAVCKISVKVPSIKLDKTSATIYAGKVKKVYSGGSVTLKATTLPAGKSVTWSSDKPAIASVSSAGKVTAKKAGTAKITAKFSYGGKTYSKTATITVKSRAGITIKSVGDLDDSYYATETAIKFKNNTNSKIVSVKFVCYYLDSDYYIIHNINGYRGSDAFYNGDVAPGETVEIYGKPWYTNEGVHGTAIETITIIYADGDKEVINWNTTYWDRCCHDHVK